MHPSRAPLTQPARRMRHHCLRYKTARQRKASAMRSRLKSRGEMSRSTLLTRTKVDPQTPTTQNSRRWARTDLDIGSNVTFVTEPGPQKRQFPAYLIFVPSLQHQGRASPG